MDEAGINIKFTVLKHIGDIIMKQVLTSLILFSTFPSATTIHIPSDYSTIQEGIDASLDGDTVLIAQGTYYENLILGKEIVLASHALYDDLGSDWHANENINNTMISGDHNGSCLIIRDGNIEPTVLGLTFQDGIGTSLQVQTDGCDLTTQKLSGGAILIYKAYPTINYNRFINNGFEEQAGGGGTSESVADGGAISHYASDDIEFDEDRGNARANTGSSRTIPNEMNIQNNYFEGNRSGDGKNFYSNGFEGSIDVSHSIFDDIDCESNSVNDFVLKSKENKAEYIQNDISGNCIEGNSFYVSMDGNNNNSGTESEPFKTIGHALSFVKDDSTITTTIHVGEGVFSPSTTGEQFPIVLPDHVHLLGASRETSILDAEADSDKQSRVIKIVEECQNIKLANFTITGGNAESAGCVGGGGILVALSNYGSVDVVLENLIVTDNSALRGGGISIYQASGPTLSDLIIQENTSQYNGGGLNIDASVASVTGGTIRGNNCVVGSSSTGGGIMMRNSEATLTKISITDNTTPGYGGGIAIYNTDAVLTNLTVSGNVGSVSGGGIGLLQNANAMIINSIIWGNDPNQLFESEAITLTVAYSNIEGGGFAGEGNISADPLFVDADNGDYTLQGGSPCIDTGTADVDGDGVDDMTDYFGAAPDMGAFEFYIAATGLQYTVDNSSVIFNWDPLENVQYYQLERSTDPAFVEDVVLNFAMDNSYTDSGLEWDTEYFYRVAAFVGYWSDYSNVVSVILEFVGTDMGDAIPETYAVHQNYPNPFNPVTTLRYSLPEDGLVNITIYDMMGRQISKPVNSFQNAGYKTIQWIGTNNVGEPVSAGVYLYTIQAGEFKQTKKMVLLK